MASSVRAGLTFPRQETLWAAIADTLQYSLGTCSPFHLCIIKVTFIHQFSRLLATMPLSNDEVTLSATRTEIIPVM